MKMGMGKMIVKYSEEVRYWILPGLLYPNNPVLCGESEQGMKVITDAVMKCTKEGV